MPRTISAWNTLYCLYCNLKHIEVILLYLLYSNLFSFLKKIYVIQILLLKLCDLINIRIVLYNLVYTPPPPPQASGCGFKVKFPRNDSQYLIDLKFPRIFTLYPRANLYVCRTMYLITPSE